MASTMRAAPPKTPITSSVERPQSKKSRSSSSLSSSFSFYGSIYDPAIRFSRSLPSKVLLIPAYVAGHVGMF